MTRQAGGDVGPTGTGRAIAAIARASPTGHRITFQICTEVCDPSDAATRVTHAERDEGGRDQQARGDREGERVQVLAGGGAILFDAVDPVQSALQLAHQDRAGDQDGHETEDQGRRAIRRAGLIAPGPLACVISLPAGPGAAL